MWRERGLARKDEILPVYEYELIDDDCLMCPGRFSVIQGLDEEPLKHCPWCGLPCKKVVSQVVMDLKGKETETRAAQKAADRGFTTWKRAKKGEWEKIAGPGVDAIVGSDEDIKAVEEEQSKPKNVLDLDNEP